jgi:hypothetical protein
VQKPKKGIQRENNAGKETMKKHPNNILRQLRRIEIVVKYLVGKHSYNLVKEIHHSLKKVGKE